MKDSSELDRLDRRILHLLQKDGRLSNAALAARVNLSESACLRRVKALEQQGLLRHYVALVDQVLAGYPDDVFVQITLHSQQQDAASARTDGSKTQLVLAQMHFEALSDSQPAPLIYSP